MRIVMTSLAVLALVACNKPAETTNEVNAADANMAMDANATADAKHGNSSGHSSSTKRPGNSRAKARRNTRVDRRQWQLCRLVRKMSTSIMAPRSMKGDKVCFTSAMDQEGEVCWTTSADRSRPVV